MKNNEIIFKGENALTLARITKGELENYGYEVSDVKNDYEPTWGEGIIKLEVKGN